MSRKAIPITIAAIGLLILGAGAWLVFKSLNGFLLVGIFLMGLGALTVTIVFAYLRAQAEEAKYERDWRDPMDQVKDEQLDNYMDGGSHRGRL